MIEEDALDPVFGYAAGLDMTRRDLPLEARDKRRHLRVATNFGFPAPMAATGCVAGVAHPIWYGSERTACLGRFERSLPGEVIDAADERLAPLQVTIGNREASFG